MTRNIDHPLDGPIQPAQHETTRAVQIIGPQPEPIDAPIECQHLTGYWINRGVNFRCYGCGCQFHLRELPRMKREIETWRAR